jgi:hypothetical protein
MKNIYLLVVVSIMFAIQTKAQNEGSAFTLTGMGVTTPFATDYQALGINPANLDLAPRYEDKMVTLGFAEFGFSFYSEVLTKPELRQNIFQEDIKAFTKEQQKQYAIEFANSDNAMDFDMMGFGISVRTNKLGTFAFNTRDRVNLYSRLGQQISDIMWLGYEADYFDSLIVDLGNGNLDTIPNTGDIDQQTLDNVQQGITSLQNAKSLSQMLQGTKFGFGWYREFSLGWGKKLFSTENIEVHGGLGVKFIVGQGMLELNGEGGQATAFSAMSPIFNIDYGSIADENPSALDSTSRKLKPVGYGYGVDLGGTIVYKEKFLFNVALNDIGQITWDGNLYKLKDVSITNFKNPGLESVDFLSQIDQLNGGDGLLEWQGEQKRVTKLPSTMRIGFGFDNRKSLRVGADVIMPMSDNLGNLETAAISVGGEYSPMPWVHLQIGYTQGGNYGIKIPVGVYFTIGQGTYEIGAASRDLVTFFRDNEPTISMTTGFLRFRF